MILGFVTSGARGGMWHRRSVQEKEMSAVRTDCGSLCVNWGSEKTRLGAAIGKFIFPKTSRTYRHAFPFALYPNDHRQTAKLIDKGLAIRPRGHDPNNIALRDLSSQRKAAA